MVSRDSEMAMPQAARRQAGLRKAAFGWRTLIALVLSALLLGAGPANAAERVVFVGNSFTFGFGSPVRFFHPELVHDPRIKTTE